MYFQKKISKYMLFVLLACFPLMSSAQLQYDDFPFQDPFLFNNGGSNTSYDTRCQLAFGWYYNQKYVHWIGTRHDDDNNYLNSIDFYLWQDGIGAANLGNNLMMSITGTGVGIGIGRNRVADGYMLHVKGNTLIDGKIDCEGVNVETISADFVFHNDYQLKSLYEVEQFIDTHQHLPDIPPASETEKGVELARFSESLLQKIEELTLYTIEQQKLIDQLMDRIEELEK
jgi:hypothetical protein